MKKSQIQVVSIVLILLIVATSSIVLFNWTQNFGEDLRNKNIQNPKIIGKDMKILGLEEKNGILNVIIRNPISGYKEIEKISLNGENCSMIGSNVITPQGISVIPIDCPTIKNINNVAVHTQYYVLESSNSIIE